MEQKSYLDISGIKNIFIHIGDNYHYKLLVSAILFSFNWVFDGKYEVFGVVYGLMLLDTFTGVWWALKNKQVSSRAFSGWIPKFFAFSIMLVVGRLVDKTYQVAWVSAIIDGFIATTEAISILENISKLGYPVPLFLVKKLKAFYEKKE